tara:strand:- start:2383 stop:2559 length:177 start_codon:yes stop_codon:yes gene_type:complete
MIKIQVNKYLGLYDAGDVVTLEKLTEFWRRRLTDAETDNNCEILPIKSTKKAKSGDNE